MIDLPETPENQKEEKALATKIADASGEPVAPKAPIYAIAGVEKFIRQGEILSNLVQFNLNLKALKNGEFEADEITHKFVIVLSQDCDCEQDYRVRSQAEGTGPVPNILFCEARLAEEIKYPGDGGNIGSSLWKVIKQNKNERYQFLEGVPADFDLTGEGLPELTLDFKRYFTLPTDEVYHRINIGEAARRTKLVSPYLEHLSARFAYFAQRVALPNDHASVEG